MTQTHSNLSNNASPSLASLIGTILTRCVERSIYCMFIVPLFLLAASYGDEVTFAHKIRMGRLWFAVQAPRCTITLTSQFLGCTRTH